MPSKNISYAEQQKEISRSISSILEQVAEMLRVAYREDVPKFTPIFNAFSESYAKTYDQVKSLIVSSNDKKTANIVDESLTTVVNSCNRLTSTVKLFTADPNPSSKIFFSEAAKNFSDDLSNMLLQIVSSKPGRRECENIKNTLQFSLRPLIESSDKEILPDKTYSSCVDQIQKLKTDKLNSIEKNLTSHISTEKNMGDIRAAVDDFGKFIDEIIKNTAQSSYILGMTDGSSTSGRSQVFDEDEIHKNVVEMKKCFESLPGTQKDLKSADVENFKKDLQKYSGNLIKGAKESVDALAGNPLIQKELLDIINSLSNAVKEAINEAKNFETISNDIELKTAQNNAKNNVLKSAEKILKLIESEGVKYIPAKIGERGKQMQDPVIADGLKFIESSLATVELLSSLIDAYDDNTKDEIQNHLNKNKKNIENLIETLKSNGPGESQYTELITRLDDINDDISAKKEKSLASTPQNLTSSSEFESRFEILSAKIQTNLKELSKLTDKSSHLRAGKFENIINLFEGLPETISNLCSAFANISPQEKTALFQTLAEISKELAHSINACRINPENIGGEKPKDYYRALDSTLKQCEILANSINTISEKSNILQGIINNFEKINNSLNIAGNSTSISTLTPYQEEELISECLKSILKNCQDLSTKTGEKSEIVNARCQNLFDQHEKCSTLVFNNRGKPPSEETTQIRKNYLQLSANIKELCEKLKSAEPATTESEKARDLNQQVKKISQNISNILKLIQLSHKGVEACSKIEDIVNDNISEIETCILFAENKALEKELNSLPISALRDPIFKSAQEISAVLANLKREKDFSDPALLEASSSLSENTKLFFDNSKKAAISLGVNDSENQITLLDATKNFGSDMSQLLASLKDGPKLQTDNEKENLVKKIDKTQNSLQNALQKIEHADQVSSKSSAVIDHAINNIEKMVTFLNPNNPCQWDNDVVNTKPEDVVRISKDIPFSLAKMTQAINAGKTKDLEENVKKGEFVFEELVKGVRKFILASNEETVKSVNECLKQAVNSYLTLLKYIKNNSVNPDMAKIQELSKSATQDIFKFVKTCSDLKAEQFADMNDPQLLAEKELLNAAASIEMAAKKLAELKPRKVSSDEQNKDLNFDGQILQAVQSIMKATSLLVTYASSAQRELVAKGVLKEKTGGDTGQWSQGLISAARLVAESTNFLVDEAKNAVEGKGNEERMIAACNSIFGSTSQLIMACKVKADPNSENQARLEKAGAAVKKASKGLVESLKGSGIFSEEKKDVVVDKTQVGGMKQMMDALEEVARREKELMEAREKLIKLRQAKPQ